MRVSYQTPDGRATDEAIFESGHPVASYGQHALVLSDGTALDYDLWRESQFLIEEATEEERSDFMNWVDAQGEKTAHIPPWDRPGWRPLQRQIRAKLNAGDEERLATRENDPF